MESKEFKSVDDLIKSLMSSIDNPNRESIENYASYCMRLKLEVDKQKKLKNPWMQNKKVDQLDILYRRVLNEGLEFDGVHVTLQSKGITYDYQAYKNKMMLVYPESIIDIDLVYEGDSFSFNKENGEVFYKHSFENPFDRSDDKIKGGYLIIKNRRGSFITTLTKEEFQKHRKVAKTDYIWAAWLKEMCLKTLWRKGVKVHFDDEFKEMNNEDNKNYDLDKSVEKDELLDLKMDINSLLETYKGDDVDDIRKLCVDKSKAGEFTIEFGKNILRQLNA